MQRSAARRATAALAIALPLMAAACADAGAPQPEGPFTMTGVLDDSVSSGPYAGESSAMIGSSAMGDTLYVSGGQPSFRLSGKNIRVRVAWRGPGTYVLGPGSVHLDHLIGGDAGGTPYVARRENAGTLVVTRLADGVVEGTLAFEADYAYVASRDARYYGPVARFTGGQFRAHVRRFAWRPAQR